ncbi:MAG: hypothetical protein WDA09_06190 [Bacteriovoracaceae bacterium]
MSNPLQPAFRRLFDAKSHWHKANAAYFEPNEFRISINSCIQELRNVTFVLQANKREIPDFDEWYAPWQEKMRANQSLKWLVEARNYIVKRGDLELLSKLRIEVIGSYLDGEIAIFEEEYNPNLTNTEVYEKTVALGLPAEVFESSYVKLQRRWIDKNYPEYELAELLSQCWSAVSELLLDAPNIEGSSRNTGTKTKLPPCMHQELEMRVAWMKVHGKTLVPAEIHSEVISSEDIDRTELTEKYGDSPIFKNQEEVKNPAEQSFKEQVVLLFEHAKFLLKKDGYHVHIVMIYVDQKLAKIIELRNEDQADKFVTIRNLASQMEQIGADSFIMISEAWSAVYDPAHHYRRAADAPNRQEVLMAIAATQADESYCFTAPFFRENNEISFGRTTVSDATEINTIQPILSMWKKQKPAHPGSKS